MTAGSQAPRRLGKLIIAIAGTALALGMTYQGVATALERRDFPAPGARINVGDHQLHLVCMGDGLPIVLLEAPELGGAAAWGRVQPVLATRTRVCAYDRSGLGWSEASGLRVDVTHTADELHALLQAAHVATPVILVGQSLGAWFARVHAQRFPGDVQHLVLVDEPEAGAPDVAPLARSLRRAPWLARTGVLRLTRQMAPLANGLPGTSAGAMRALLLRPDHLARAAGEVDQWDRVGALAADTASAPAPITRVTTPGHRPGTFPVTADDERAIRDAVFPLLPTR